MRIHRIRLKNFGGVVESDVSLQPKGVTIVQGPNETGKSTLIQAIDLLFDYRDDSRREDVRDVQPVNRDVGAEVEADLDIAGCRFIYFKRFHRDRETRLHILAPKVEHLTGREAHERVQELLSATLDTALWKALRIVQGEKVDLPNLKGQPALAKALDRAAGQALSGDREEALFDTVRAEYLQYWTDTGKEKEDPLVKVRVAATLATNTVQDLRGKLASMEADVATHARLEREIATARQSLVDLEKRVDTSQQAWDQLSKIKNEVERLRSAHEAATAKASAAKSADEERQRLIDSVKQFGQRVEVLSIKEKVSQAAIEAAALKLAGVLKARGQAKDAAELAEKGETLRRMDQDFHQNKFDLALMEERLGRIVEAEKAAINAQDILSRLRITEKLRDKIRSADVDVTKARAILESASPHLYLKALRAVDIVLNGVTEKLVRGEERQAPVPEAVAIRVADAIELRVEPGTSDVTLRETLSSRQMTLSAACEQAGVANGAEAETAWTARQQAERALVQRDSTVKENLRDLTRDELERHIVSTRSHIESYLASRPVKPTAAGTLGEAKQLLVGAERDALRVKAERTTAEATFEAARQQHDKLREDRAGDAALLAQAREDMQRANARLVDERRRFRDETFSKEREITASAEHAATQALASAKKLLLDADPEAAAARLQTALAAYKKAQMDLAKTNDTFVQLRGRLDTLGEQGLAEALAEAERVSFEAADGLKRLLRRATATKLLYELLCSERDAARRTYVAPLRERIQGLGKHVFGSTFQVDVDDELRVVSRTLEGVTVPFRRLSTGAREQIGLLMRLAVALIVAQDGGVPLVLDDALVSTDAERMEALGTVLSLAGRECQTIVITCSPERYVHVDAAARVRLEAARLA